PVQLLQLTRDPRTHAGCVDTLLPVGELSRMADPAPVRLERGLEWTEANRRRALRRDRRPPVTLEELLQRALGPGAAASSAGQRQAETGQQQNPRGAITHQLYWWPDER